MSFDVTANVVAPATLADYTRPELIVPRLRERDTAGIISELSQALQREGCVADVLPFYHAALNRELLTNSSLDCGMAFPHARLSGIKQLRFALGRSPEPVICGGKGAAPVRLIFLIAVPATDAAGYLHLLASLARMAQSPQLFTELVSAQTANAMLAVLSKIGIRQA